MSKNWVCNFFGHKWLAVYLKGEFNGIVVKFIGTYCERCLMGLEELHDTNEKFTVREYGTYSERFFNDKAGRKER